jgi:hypothetical protein
MTKISCIYYNLYISIFLQDSLTGPIVKSADEL